MESEKIPVISSLQKILLVVVAFLVPMVLSVVLLPLVIIYFIITYMGPQLILAPVLLFVVISIFSFMPRKIMMAKGIQIKYPIFTFMGSFILNVLGMFLVGYLFNEISTGHWAFPSWN